MKIMQRSALLVCTLLSIANLNGMKTFRDLDYRFSNIIEVEMQISQSKFIAEHMTLEHAKFCKETIIEMDKDTTEFKHLCQATKQLVEDTMSVAKSDSKICPLTDKAILTNPNWLNQRIEFVQGKIATFKTNIETVNGYSKTLKEQQLTILQLLKAKQVCEPFVEITTTSDSPICCYSKIISNAFDVTSSKDLPEEEKTKEEENTTKLWKRMNQLLYAFDCARYIEQCLVDVIGIQNKYIQSFDGHITTLKEWLEEKIKNSQAQ